MITTVIVPWEVNQMCPACEWQVWGALKGPMGIDHFIFVSDPPVMDNLAYDHVKTMEEALALATGTLVFLDATGSKDISQIPKTGDVTIVVGTTNLGLVPYAQSDELYRIDQVGVGEMYGVNAAVIALDHRHGNYG